MSSQTTSTEAPVMSIDLTAVARTATAHAVDRDSLMILSENAVVNHIPARFRAHVVRTDGVWRVDYLSVYRTDTSYFGENATDSMRSKVFKAVIAAADTVPEAFLMNGERARIARDRASAERAFEQATYEYREQLNRLDAEEYALDVEAEGFALEVLEADLAALDDQR